MCEVMRYDLDRETDESCADMVPADGGQYVESVDFDRVTAERDALQLRLNAADQKNDDLVAELANVRQGPCKMIVGDELP